MSRTSDGLSESQPSERRWPWAVLALVAVGTGIRLALASFTAGTNDVDTWLAFIDAAGTDGVLDLYTHVQWPSVPVFRFNHGPLMAWLIGWVAALDLTEIVNGRFLVRLPAIAADAGSTLVVYRVTRSVATARAGLLAAALVALNPVLVLVSGFHGNTDPVFVLFVLVSAVLIANGRPGWAGLSFAVALGVKIVPAIVALVLLFGIGRRVDRLLFLGTAAGVSLALWLPFIIGGPAVVAERVLGYRGIPDVWGLGMLVFDLFSIDPNGAVRELWLLALMAMILAASRRVEPEDVASIIDTLGWVFLIFVAFTPGFGVQYLSWPVVFLAVTRRQFSRFYALVGGAFLYSVYAWWSGGLVLGFANSWESPRPDWTLVPSSVFGPAGEILMLATWLMAVGMSLYVAVARRKEAPAQADLAAA